MFSRDQLKEQANRSSYERGLNYFNTGCVKNVIKSGNVFEGKVRGSSLYKVKLEVAGKELFFECSCPYDYDGICKHAVALGLAVIDQNYTEEQRATIVEDAIVVSDQPADELFLTYFSKVDQASKNDFLLALLSRNADLRAQFLHFLYSQVPAASEKASTPPGKPVASPTLLINPDTVRDEVFRLMSAMDFDELDYDTYDQKYDRYVEEWEHSQDIAADMIRDALSPYTQKAITFVQKGDLVNGYLQMSGIFEAISRLTEPASDDMCIFNGLDYRDEVLNLFDEQMLSFNDTLKGVILSEAMVMQVFDLLVERALKMKAETNEDFEEVFPLNILAGFQSLLLTLLTSATLADHLYSLLTKHRLLDQETVFIVFRIAELKQNEKLWLETAEKFLDSEPAVASLMLEKFHAKGDWENFIRIAKKVMSQRPQEFDQYLLDTLPKDLDPTLYLAALENLTQRTRSLTHYLELRTYWTEVQRADFIKKQYNRYSHLFYVQMLAAEKQHEKILELLKNENLDGISDFDQLISPIVSVYPTESFEMVVAKCRRELEIGKGRSSYHLVAQWLKTIEAEQSLKEEVKAYVMHLFNSKPILPALRDELKKAKLV
jgi:hypothetical protein